MFASPTTDLAESVGFLVMPSERAREVDACVGVQKALCEPAAFERWVGSSRFTISSFFFLLFLCFLFLVVFLIFIKNLLRRSAAPSSVFTNSPCRRLVVRFWISKYPFLTRQPFSDRGPFSRAR